MADMNTDDTPSRLSGITPGGTEKTRVTEGPLVEGGLHLVLPNPADHVLPPDSGYTVEVLDTPPSLGAPLQENPLPREGQR